MYRGAKWCIVRSLLYMLYNSSSENLSEYRVPCNWWGIVRIRNRSKADFLIRFLTVEMSFLRNFSQFFITTFPNVMSSAVLSSNVLTVFLTAQNSRDLKYVTELCLLSFWLFVLKSFLSNTSYNDTHILIGKAFFWFENCHNWSLTQYGHLPYSMLVISNSSLASKNFFYSIILKSSLYLFLLLKLPVRV